MKRILSLGLAAVLALGSVPMTFAAEATSGEMLKEAGFVAGDASGNLNEDQKITREQMMVLIAEMNGVKEEAATFGIPADFTDVSEDDWFAPYVWYAFYQGWTTGMGDGTFGAGKAVDSRMAATFMLKALGYEVADYNASVEQAKEVGIEVSTTTELTRGEAFDAMWDTVNLPKEGSDVALGVELGRLEAQTPVVSDLEATIDEAYAVGTKVIDVTFENDVDADEAEAADFSIVKKGTSEAVDIERVQAVASDRVYIFTEELKAGDAYTVVLGDQAYNFSALHKETDKPEVESVTGEDTGLIEVEFDSNLDWDSATDIANYSINKEGTVVAASVKDDYQTVELYVEGITKRQSLKLTIENVLNADGVKMDKDTNSFYPAEDDDAPKIEEVNPEKLKNNYEVEIYFDDDHGVDKATAEDVSNYAIEGVEILSAEVDDVYWDDDAKEEKDTDNDYYNKVTLTTAEMDANDKYELKVLYMMDGSLAKNATTKTLEETFRAGSEDDDAPELKSVDALSETVVKVVFDEDNDLDPVTALDTSNYEFDDNDASVYNVWFKDDDEEEHTLYVETSKLDKDEKYKLIVNNVADVVGNTMEKEDEKSFDLDDVNYNGASAVENVVVKDLETLIVEFSDPVKGVDAEDPTNYEIDNFGKVKDAEWIDDSDYENEYKEEKYDKVVVLYLDDELDNNEEYTLVVDGIENFAERTMEDYEYDFVATSDENDDEKPEVDNVDERNEGIILVEFSEKMKIGSTIPDVALNEDSYEDIYDIDGDGNTTEKFDMTNWNADLDKIDNLSYMVVEVNNNDSDLKEATQYYMIATAQTDDDETVVFNGFTIYDKATGARVNMNKKDVDFDVVSFENVWDEALNDVDYDDGDEEFGVDSDFTADELATTQTADNQRIYTDNDSVEVNSADQEDPDEVNVYFDEEIMLLQTSGMKLYKDSDEDGDLSSTEDNSAEYKVTLDDDDDDETLVILELSDADYFKEDQEILLVDLNDYVADLIGRPVSMETISFDTDNEDDEEPGVDDVRAINERQVEVEWDVDLSDEGDYEITNEDDDDWNKGTLKIDSNMMEIDDNVVTITLDKGHEPFDSHDTYVLKVTSNVESLYGKNSDVKGDTWDFGGSSTPYVGNKFSGVSYLNGTQVKVIDDDDFEKGDKLISISGGTIQITDTNTLGYISNGFTTTSGVDDSYVLEVADYTPFIDGVEYEVKIEPDEARRLENDSLVAGNFTGTVEQLEADTTQTTSDGATELVLSIDNLESSSDFTYQLFIFEADASNSAVADLTKMLKSSSFHEDESATVAGTNVSGIKISEEKLTFDVDSNATYKYAILVVKDGGNVRYVTKEIAIIDPETGN